MMMCQVLVFWSSYHLRIAPSSLDAFIKITNTNLKILNESDEININYSV